MKRNRLHIGPTYRRGHTAGTHPRFVTMIRELILGRMTGADVRPALGCQGPAAPHR